MAILETHLSLIAYVYQLVQIEAEEKHLGERGLKEHNMKKKRKKKKGKGTRKPRY